MKKMPGMVLVFKANKLIFTIPTNFPRVTPGSEICPTSSAELIKINFSYEMFSQALGNHVETTYWPIFK